MPLSRSMNKFLAHKLPLWPITLAGVYLIWSVLGVSKMISFSPICIIKYWTNIACLGCGTSRSVHAILHGNFREAFHYNPLGYLIILAFLGYLILLLLNLLKKSDDKF